MSKKKGKSKGRIKSQALGILQKANPKPMNEPRLEDAKWIFDVDAYFDPSAQLPEPEYEIIPWAFKQYRYTTKGPDIDETKKSSITPKTSSTRKICVSKGNPYLAHQSNCDYIDAEIFLG